MTVDMHAFWNERGRTLGHVAGTQDDIAVQIEQRFLRQWVPESGRMLDVGCGAGDTLTRFAAETQAECIGLDFSEEMLSIAKARDPDNRCAWLCHDLTKPLPVSIGYFDLIYTERALINLQTWAEQESLVRRLRGLLRASGWLVCVECSYDGLLRLNTLRVPLGLPPITPPPHTNYLHDRNMRLLHPVQVIDYSAAYYFLSRVVNARLALDAGEDPDYHARVNQFALDLPLDVLQGCGQGRAWVFGPERVKPW